MTKSAVCGKIIRISNHKQRVPGMTQKEIAKALNITQAAVSMALKGSERISPGLRDSVRKLAENAGYQPNLAGQMLRGGRTSLIGAVFPRLTNPFYAELFQEIQNQLRPRGYMLYFAPAETPEELQKTVTILRQMRVAGVIGLANGGHELLPLTEDGIALVLYGGDTKLDLGVSQILPDRYEAALQLMHFLLARGRRQIAFLGAPLETEPRFRAYSDALRKAGRPLLPIPFATSPDDSMHAGFRATEAFLRLHPETDAIFAHNDELALGAKRAIAFAGHSIPDDIALAGFDNISTGAYLTPSLTTVDQPRKQITNALIAELFESLKNPDHHAFHSIPCRLVIREST